MQYRASSFPSWRRSFFAVSLAVAFTAAFFVVTWSPAAYAQQPGQRPDFKVTVATYDGRNLHVEYINATGIGYPVRRYEVGFQWYDARGELLGVRHWLPVPEVERGGVSILDNRSRTDLSYRSGRSVYGKRLSQFIAERPSRATELRIIVDDGDRIAEEDERNNTASLKVPLPDIVLRDVKLTSDTLTFTYANPTDTSVPGSFRIALQWMTPDGLPAGQEFGTQVGLTEPKEARQFPRYARELLYAGSGNQQTYLYASDFVRKRQSNAEMLRITIDPQNGIAESNEQNNIENVFPTVPKPDLAIGEATWTPEQFVLTFRNRGDGAAATPSLWFHFVDAQGRQVGRLTWLDTRTLPVGASATVKGTSTTLGSSTGSIAFSDFLAKPPDGATHLKVLLDGPNAIAETDEGNNTVVLTIPVIPVPDLAFGGMVFTAEEGLTFNYRNVGDELPDRQVVHFTIELRWLDARGDPTGKPYGISVGAGFPKDYLHWFRSSESAPMTAFITKPPDGAERLQVTLDSRNDIAEKNEQNNQLIGNLPPRPTPDLTVASLTLGADGRPALVIKNIGDVTVTRDFNWELTYHRADGQATLQQTATVKLGPKGLAPGATITISGPILDRPASTDVKVRGTVDPTQVIPESDEGNNVKEVPIPQTEVVEPKPIVSLLPDLAITTFALGAERGAAIEDRTSDILRIRFRNLGGATALTQSGDSLIPFWLLWSNADGQPVAGASRYWFDLRRDPLLPGMEGVFHLTHAHGAILVPHGAGRGAGRTITQFLADPAVGATHLQAVIDGPNRIAESNETNNTAIIERPAPDLVIEQVEYPTVDALTIRYRNRGVINALDRSGIGVLTFWLAWTNVDGQAVAGAPRYWVNHRSNSLLRPGEERVLALQEAHGAVVAPHGSDLKSGRTIARFLAEAPENATHLQVVIDGPNTYAESDERNNVVLLPKPDVAKPDVAKPDLALRNATLADGKLKVTIVNTGKGPAERVMWQLRWLGKSGDALATSALEAAVGALKPDASYPVEFAYANARPFGIFGFLQDMPDGATALEIAVDPKNAIAESDEGNNTTRTALPGTDLAIGVATVRGDALIIPVVNHGTTASVPTDMWLQWYGKGKWLPGSGAVDVPAINGGATVEVKVPLNRSFGPDGKLLTDIPPTAERLRLFVDGLRKVPERNEQNNDRMVDRAALLAPAADPEKPTKPDLVAEGLRIAPARPVPGSIPSFTVTVSNRGSARAESATAWFSVDFDADGEPDMAPESSATPALDPGEQYPVAWPDGVEVPLGTHIVEFCVDVEEEVAESNEDNNCTTMRFTVGSGAFAPPPHPRSSLFAEAIGAILRVIATPIVAGTSPEGERAW